MTDAKAQTKYQVLEARKDGLYELVGMAEVSSAESAIRQLELDDGTYVAVPDRSFVAKVVKTEKVTHRRLLDVKKMTSKSAEKLDSEGEHESS